MCDHYNDYELCVRALNKKGEDCSIFSSSEKSQSKEL